MVRVPVRLMADEEREVIEPDPRLKSEEKRFVLDAVVLKREV